MLAMKNHLNLMGTEGKNVEITQRIAININDGVLEKMEMLKAGIQSVEKENALTMELSGQRLQARGRLETWPQEG